MVYSLHFVFGHATLLPFKEQLGVATPLTGGWGLENFEINRIQVKEKCLQEDGDSTKIVCNRTRI